MHFAEASMKLPESIRTHLRDRFPRDSRAIELVTASEDDQPRPAHLSAGEVALGDDHLIRLARWIGSRSCIALRERPIDEVLDHLAVRVLDQLRLDHPAARRWSGMKSAAYQE
jgi:hypothetical protein